ncbi:VCBS domain-containing protein, partial [Alphaproteobacteria bacterium]|nr:VCBS domain-containing protein [Alphaproteobacteria bacterium]
IEELAELTAADIAASDDITGTGGDWELEVNTGPIEADTVEAWDYQYSLANGIASVNSNTVDKTPTSGSINVKASPDGGISDSQNRFMVVLEKANITTNDRLYFDQNVSVSYYDVGASTPVASYLVMLNDNTNRRTQSLGGSITFENRILGFYTHKNNTLKTGTLSYDGNTNVSTLDNSYFSNSSWTYPTAGPQSNQRDFEGTFGSHSAVNTWGSDGNDHVSYANNYTLYMAAKNGNASGTGDFVRVITEWAPSNSPPTVTSAADVSGSVTELVDGHADENTATITDAGYFNIADNNNDSVSVSRNFSSTTHSSNSAFGDLTATVANDTTDGTGYISWSYAVNDSALNALDAGESYTETWVVTVSDGTASTTQNVTVTINGAADPVAAAQDDFAFVYEGSTVSVSDGANASGVTGGFTDANDPLNVSFSGSSTTDVEGVHFNNDGTKLYLNDQESGDYQQYSLSTPFDVNPATWDSRTFNGPSGSRGLAFNSDGTKAFTVNYSTDLIYEYNLSSAYNIDTASLLRSRPTADAPGTSDSVPEDLAFNSDGTKLYYLEQSSKRIYQLNLSTAYNISTASDGGHLDVSDQQGSKYWNSGLALSPDGRKLFAIDSQNTVYEWFLQTADDITSATLVGERTYLAHGALTGISFSNDGTKAFMADAIVSHDEDAVEFNALIPFSNIFASGGHSGDLLHTSRASSQDSGSNLSVNGFRVGGVEGQGTFSHSNGGSLEGEYGTLTMQLNGAYSYTANSDIANLDAGEVVYDQFNYRVQDGDGNNDHAVLTITIVGQDDSPTVEAQNDFASVNEGASVTADTLSGVLHTTDTASQDTGDNLTVQSFRTGSVLGQGTSQTVGEALAGTYGSLTLSLNGNYTYQANSGIHLLRAGETAYDFFNYTAVDSYGNTDSATLRITITGVDDVPNSKPVGVANMSFNVEDRTQPYLNVKSNPNMGDERTNDEGVGDGFISHDTSTHQIVIALEKSNITALPHSNALPNNNTDNRLYFDFAVAANSYDASAPNTPGTTGVNYYTVSDAQPVASYLIALNDAANIYGNWAEIEFENEILGYFVGNNNTVKTGAMEQHYDHDFSDQGYTPEAVDRIDNEDFSNANWTYPDPSVYAERQHRNPEGYFQTPEPANNGVQGYGADDYVWTSDNFTINIAAANGIVQDGTGDFVRVITKWQPVNSAPTITGATDVSGSVAELGENDVNENSATTTDTGSFTVADADNDAVSIVSNTLLSTDHTSNAAFGNLVATVTDNTSDDGAGTISWEYSVNDSDLDALEHGETYTEVWTVTFTDGDENVTQNVTVTITGAGDVLAQDDYGSVMEGNTLSAGDGSSTYGLSGYFGVAGLTNLYDPLDVVNSGSTSFARTYFNADGSKVYLNYDGTGLYRQYSLQTNYDVGGNYSYDGVEEEIVNGGRGLEFNPDGTKVFIHSYVADRIYEFTLSTAYRLNTISATSTHSIYTGSSDYGEESIPIDANFSDDGSKLFYLGGGNDKIYQLNLSTPYSLASVSLAGSFSVLDQGTSWVGFTMSKDGRKAFAVDSSKNIHEYFLHSANDISTATYIGAVNLGNSVTTVRGITLNGDGTRVYVNDADISSNRDVVQFSLTQPNSVFFQANSHSGDVLHTNNENSGDSGSSLSVASIRKGSNEGSGNPGTLGSALSGDYGSLTMQSTGAYSYAANSNISNLDAGEVLYDQFNYTLQDGNGNTDTAVLTITIVGQDDPNQPPTVSTEAVDSSANEAVDASSQVLSGSGTIVFADDTDSSLTITAQTSSTVSASSGVTLSNSLQNALAASITLNDNGDNTADWTLNADGLDLDFLAVGDSITIENVVTATDDQGESVTDTITVTINGTNDAPTAANNTVTTNEDTAHTFAASEFNFADVDSDSLDHITIATLPATGTLTLSGTAVEAGDDIAANQIENLAYTPVANGNGDPYTSFTFTVNDGTADSASSYTMTVDVTPVNDAPTA